MTSIYFCWPVDPCYTALFFFFFFFFFYYLFLFFGVERREGSFNPPSYYKFSDWAFFFVFLNTWFLLFVCCCCVFFLFCCFSEEGRSIDGHRFGYVYGVVDVVVVGWSLYVWEFHHVDVHSLECWHCGILILVSEFGQIVGVVVVAAAVVVVVVVVIIGGSSRISIIIIIIIIILTSMSFRPLFLSCYEVLISWVVVVYCCVRMETFQFRTSCYQLLRGNIFLLFLEFGTSCLNSLCVGFFFFLSLFLSFCVSHSRLPQF